MSVDEQPMKNSDAACSLTDADTSEPDSPQVADKRHALRDTLIAVSILSVSALAVGLYFHFSKNDDAASGQLSPVSATSWIKTEAEAPTGAADSEPAASAKEDNGSVAPPEAPKESEQPFFSNSPDEDKNTRHGTVKSGVPVIVSLQKLGLSLQNSHAIISALKGIFDFRKARPGNTFTLRVNDANEPVYFSYRVSLTEVYEVAAKGNALKGRKKHIPTVKKVRRFGGTIASSLYKTLSSIGADPSLSGKIVGVLANEVNFYKEQRPGDTFRVIVEEESLNGKFLGYGPIKALEYRGVRAGKKRFFLLEASGREPEYFNEKGISQPRSVITVPLHYTRISSPFGMRFHPVLKRKKLHNGVDFAAPVGEPIWACQEGTVTFAAKKGANGNLVAIRHAGDLYSYYAHLHRFASGIKSGVKVRKRQVIGYVGNTGRSTGPHLHFGLKKNGKFIDPLKYRVQPGRPPAAKYRKLLKNIIRKQGRLLDRTPITPATEPLADVPEHKSGVLGEEDW